MNYKRSNVCKIALTCLITVMVLGSVPAGERYGASLEDEKNKQEQMQNELKDTQTLLNKLEKLKGDTEKYIITLDQRLNALADNIYNLEIEVLEKKASIEETKKQVAEAQAEVDIQYEAMKLRIQYMYENGQFTYMSMLFGSDSMTDMLNKAEYLGQITNYDREQLEKYKQVKAELNIKQAKLESELKELEATLVEIEEEQKATDILLASKQKELSNHIHGISDAKDDIHDLESDLETQKAIVAELEEIERKRKENALNKITYDGGTMIWPIASYTRISSYFGTRPDPFGKPTQEYHSGMDMAAPKGTKIYAAYDGEVAWSYYSSSAGNWIGIDHGNGIYTVYMHMSKRIAKEGQMVKKGQVIGEVGSTGRSTGNHLHFGVRVNGKYVDPLDWVMIPKK
ncbi:MAG: peptidoglycan DD-metalloendopeptidase family protein [Lachnospiraceae bacterium]|nr:peptidoglycan DD-metalloendopeptidase family protein [Lachnospiraceae bacterium]